MALSPYVKNLRRHIGNDMLLLPSVGAAVFDGEGRILFARHADHGGWVWPGGACEPEEEPADCVVREVWEETGLWVEPTSLLGVSAGPNLTIRYPNGDLVSYVMSVFECRLLGGDLRPDQKETLEARFFSFDEVRELDLAPWVPRVLPILLSRRGIRGFEPARWQPHSVNE